MSLGVRQSSGAEFSTAEKLLSLCKGDRNVQLINTTSTIHVCVMLFSDLPLFSDLKWQNHLETAAAKQMLVGPHRYS